MAEVRASATWRNQKRNEVLACWEGCMHPSAAIPPDEAIVTGMRPAMLGNSHDRNLRRPAVTAGLKGLKPVPTMLHEIIRTDIYDRARGRLDSSYGIMLVLPVVQACSTSQPMMSIEGTRYAQHD